MAEEKLLLVDDDPEILRTHSRFLASRGYEVLAAESGREALAAITANDIPVAIVDILLPDLSGLELLARIKELSPDTEVILYTGLGTLDSALQALRLGAYDYLVKTELRLPELQRVVEQALERRRLSQANRELLQQLKEAKEELARTRARELAQIRRLGETLARPRSLQELLQGLLDLVWEALPFQVLGMVVSRENPEGTVLAVRHRREVRGEAEELLTQWLLERIQAGPFQAGEEQFPLPEFPALLLEPLEAEKVRGLAAGLRSEPFSAEEAELFRIFVLQGEAALRHVLLFEEVKNLAIRDDLTGLYNRRYFQEVLAHQVQICHRYHWPLSLLFLDLDDFKLINDTRGHAVGDLVLRFVADYLKAHLRHADVISRYGGEEFVVLLPQTNQEQAFLLAERLRQGIAATPVPAGEEKLWVTVSVGVSSLTPPMSGDDLLQSADAAMYRAKQAGKNRVSD